MHVGSVLRSGHRSLSFVTTPIFYVNSVPHLGHLYTTVLADALHRFHEMQCSPDSDSEFLLSTGTDEHGLKVEKAATANKLLPLAHCDSVSDSFRRMCREFDIGYTDFIRTTEQRHKDTVTHVWKTLEKQGHIHKANYQGWYSVTEESFLPESQVSEKLDGSGKKIKVSTETGHPVEWTKEENYVFNLEAFQTRILKWIKDEQPIQPVQFAIPVTNWLQSCQQLSVSRPSSRLSWGIPVPGDPSQVIYVWLDALINYLTVGGYATEKFVWPPTTQIIGKDILKFHTIFWPAFLLAADLELPRKILCHSHWTVNNVKMSKSLGNVIDPFVLKNKYGEGVRYFLLREGVPHSDGNFNEEKLFRLVNAELADTLGNLLNRCCSKALNPTQVWPKYCETNFSKLSSQNCHVLKKLLEQLPDVVATSFSDCNFYRGLERIMETLRLANLFVQEEKPWDIVKVSPNEPSLLALLNLVMETLRVTGLLLSPVVPRISCVLLDRLSVPNELRRWDCIRPFNWETGSTEKFLGKSKDVLFQKARQPKTASL